MAHKVLIGGTAYAVAKGRTLVNGTGRDIKKGRTLVNGTGCDIVFGGALKWVLNAVIALPLKELRANFTTASILGGTDAWLGIAPGENADGFDILGYISSSGGTENLAQAYLVTNRTWTTDAYRTITFAEPPEDELLEWLEANGTPQE